MLLFANNARSTLRVGITAAETEVWVQPNDGKLFPVVAAGNSFFITVIDADGNLEIMEVTARDGDRLTVSRSRDGSSAKGFAAGAVIDHRAVAEVFRRMSVQNLLGQPDGVAPLDNNRRIPVIHMPTTMLTVTAGDQRYVGKGEAGQANGFLQLDQNGKVPFDKLPTELVTQAEGDSLYIPLTAKGQPNGVPILDDKGKLPASYIADTTVDLTPYAKLQDPAFPGAVTVGGKGTFNEMAVINGLTAGPINARSLATTEPVVIMGGSPRGRLTLSTAPPSGSPAPGDEWVQHEV